MKRTDFLDPRQAFILTSLANANLDVHVRFEGGHPDAERRRAIIAPEYRVLEGEDAGIRVISISSPDDSLAELDHGDYMGAILGLGLKRDKIGDIYPRADGCHIVVAAENAEYISIQLNQVHRVHVRTEILPADQLQPSQSRLEELQLSVASLRLDGIASDVYRLSRAKILMPIKAGRCKVNWKQEEDPSKPLKEGDVVSMKGFGRFTLLEVEGLSKKGRHRIRVGKYV
ncbi:RNA-binding protein YlmH, contains S4-like domain [Paenibacillus sp. UNCCL117]|nr:RNA-binding protein YlmH, contains S4-like domain [Paenibacillus sp. cl123]SFW25303.1 RNA-binding protein YlmH, contains S4-like domain [Paenibacillus sp. UNCCL117]